MPMLIVQLAILIAIAFVIGCLIGRLIRGRKAVTSVREDAVVIAALSTPALDEKPEPVAASVEAPQETKAAQPVEEKAVPAAEIVPAADKPVQRDAEPEQAEEAIVEEIALEPVDPDRPALLAAPLHDKPDELIAIRGIGKAVEEMLNQLGVFHYSQIAEWSVEQAGWIDRHIGFAGRVTREDWISQAAKLVQTTPAGVSKPRTRSKKAGTTRKPATRAKKKQS